MQSRTFVVRPQNTAHRVFLARPGIPVHPGNQDCRVFREFRDRKDHPDHWVILVSEDPKGILDHRALTGETVYRVNPVWMVFRAEVVWMVYLGLTVSRASMAHRVCLEEMEQMVSLRNPMRYFFYAVSICCKIKYSFYISQFIHITILYVI